MKPIVMLTGYGSGAAGIASGIWRDHDGPMVFDEEKQLLIPDDHGCIVLHGTTFTYENLEAWVKPMQTALFDKFPIIKECRNACMAYMQECIQANPNRFCWTTPNGFECHRRRGHAEPDPFARWLRCAVRHRGLGRGAGCGA
jgi:hypothetical protein